MALSFRREPSAAPAEALVFAEGFTDFDALAEDLDVEFGEGQWEEIKGADAEEALRAAEKASFAVFAVSSDAHNTVEDVAYLIKIAQEAGLLILLVAGEISSRTMLRLMREGVSESAPYPDADGALAEAFSQLRVAKANANDPNHGTPAPERKGRVITIYGAAGGVGASTMAVNLAWEIASATKKEGLKVALLDFNFQYGSIATYLDVPRREAVYELVSEASSLDQTGLTQALSVFDDLLHVLTAPRDALPLDIVSPSDIKAIIDLACGAFDYVLIDMPQALMNWSEQVYMASEEFYAVMEVDMRSAQNMFRFLRTLKAEDMALDRIKFVLNRAPGLTDLSGKARVRRVAESLGIEYAAMLPDGGKQVMNACDQGVPLLKAAKSNPMRKEIGRLCDAILKSGDVASAKAG
ncbi:MAG: P-loop NTPase [Pseudomonadota bacterium]